MKRKSKKNKKLLIQTLLIITIISLFYIFTINEIIPNKENIISKNNLGLYEEEIDRDIKLEFCPSENCLNLFLEEFDKANKNIFCAFYDLENKNIINKLNEKSKKVEVKLIIDNEYLDEENLEIIEESSIQIYSDEDRKTRFNNYMHHKFCIIDEKTLLLKIPTKKAKTIAVLKINSGRDTQTILIFKNTGCVIIVAADVPRRVKQQHESLPVQSLKNI
jgi:hypothetical protein